MAQQQQLSRLNQHVAPESGAVCRRREFLAAPRSEFFLFFFDGGGVNGVVVVVASATTPAPAPLSTLSPPSPHDGLPSSRSIVIEITSHESAHSLVGGVPQKPGKVVVGRAEDESGESAFAAAIPAGRERLRGTRNHHGVCGIPRGRHGDERDSRRGERGSESWPAAHRGLVGERGGADGEAVVVVLVVVVVVVVVAALVFFLRTKIAARRQQQ